MAKTERSEILPGTLEMLILKTLTIAPMHGYGIAQHLQQLSEDVLQVDHGSLYPALARLEKNGFISSKWEANDAGRELRRYRLEYATCGDGALSISALLNRQKFIDRIDQAIAQHGTEIKRLQRQFEQGRASWHQAHARENALGTVIDRFRDEERQAGERQEQAEMDERSQFRRNR